MGRGLLPAPSCTLGGGGGGMAALVPGASPYRELDARAGPRRGPHLPGRCRAAPAGRGWLMVSGQWLAGCGAAGSSPRLAPPHSLPRVAAHPRELFTPLRELFHPSVNCLPPSVKYFTPP